MAWGEFGNKAINSTGFVPVVAGSTVTLYAELDSTLLGTKDFVANQSRNFQVTYIMGGDTNITWQVGTCTGVALGSGVEEFYPKTATGQSAQFTVQHTLEKDHRIRIRQFSTGANGAGFISAVPLT